MAYNSSYTGPQVDSAVGQVVGENIPASSVKFSDGQTFQQKYDAGQLTGPQGPAGSNGQDGSPGQNGADGEDGGYYQPSVDGSGNLTWTASKSGMPAVSGANIKGATGPAGTNGKDATINGVNTLTIVEGDNINLNQSGSTLTISASGGVPVVTTGGTGSAYTATVPGVTELKDGMLLAVNLHTANSNNPTLNVNGIGAKTIGISDIGFNSGNVGAIGVSKELAAYSLQPGYPILLQYHSALETWVLRNNFRIEQAKITVVPNSNYTTNQVRGIALRTSTPSSIPLGSIVGVYST